MIKKDIMKMKVMVALMVVVVAGCRISNLLCSIRYILANTR